MTERIELDQDALTKAHVAVEEEVIDRRDRRIFVLHANGVVVREADGQDSSIMRMGTREALAYGICAYLEALGGAS